MTVHQGQSEAPESPAPMQPPAEPSTSVYSESPSMFPQVAEEVTNSVEKDGISYVLECRSLTAVVRYVYTPLEGNLSDLELEINNADPIKISEDGGVTIEMGGTEWAASNESVERHFVSCELVDDCVEARWQWKRGEELADLLFRISVRGKSLVFEIEGGSGKATGVDLGYVSGAIQPRLLRVPYFNVGSEDSSILCSSGVFVSSFLDWFYTASSGFGGPTPTADARELRLTSGCVYQPATDGKRNNLRERWILTVSRQFEEVLPSIPKPAIPADHSAIRELIWYDIPHLESVAEAYVDIYERLRSFRQWGMDKLLVVHPDDVWHDGDGRTALSLTASADKGGDDALLEYLEAVGDLGYPYALCSSYGAISPLDPGWTAAESALRPDGDLAEGGVGRHLLKPSRAAAIASDHLPSLMEKYGARAAHIAVHAATPPWDRVDFDAGVERPASFLATLQGEQSLLMEIREDMRSRELVAVGEGGNHWLYTGLLAGFSSRMPGPRPCRQPLLVDFDLRNLHVAEVHAGVGSTEHFFQGEAQIPESLDSRNAWLDRYLATTVAFGHAGLLPNPSTWDLPAIIKAYYLLQHLQTHYLGVEVASITYHRNGQMLETTEALVSGAYEESQVLVTYKNGLRIFASGSWARDWDVQAGDHSFSLPPASFVGLGTQGPIAYSADMGSGRIDYAACDDYLYCDTRGNRMTLGAMTLSGAALLRHQNWEIDVYPVLCDGEIAVEPGLLWPERRLPKLRVLAFKDEDDEPQTLSANMSGDLVLLEPSDDVYKYRITLPEWMVEPGQ